MKFKKIEEGLKETFSRPWDGLKGQEKLDAIKKFCAENPSLDPARVLCSDDGLARVEEEPIIIGDYKFVQDGRAWNVYKNDEFFYTGTRAAVCRQISDLWEKDMPFSTSENIQEDVDVRSGIEKRVARDIANETEIPEDFVYQCFDSWRKFGFNLKSGEPVDTEELKWLVVSEYNRA